MNCISSFAAIGSRAAWVRRAGQCVAPGALASMGLLLFAGLLGLSSGCKNVASVTVPMQFRPTDPLNTNAVAGSLPGSGGAKVYVAPVEDKRDNRELIGQNTEKSTAVPVYASGKPPAEFFRDVLQQDMKDSGIDLVNDPTTATRIIDVELNKFFVAESDKYRGEVRATIKVSDPSGAVVWRGPLVGNSDRFGRSLSEENYQEAISDALRNLTQGLLINPRFISALGSGGGAGGAP